MPQPPTPQGNGSYHDAQRALELNRAAPRLLDALRLIRFALITDHDDSRTRAEKVLKLCEFGLKGTEDL